MTLRERINALKADEGVSPVIAVILMVAITVVLAATVYVWVSGFASEQEGPEQASATASGVDLGDNGDVEWVKVTLTSGENAPYGSDDVTTSGTDPSGNSLAIDTHFCTDAKQGGSDECTNDFKSSSSDWKVGQNLWVPCQEEGTHLVTISVRDSTILDTSVTCDEKSSAPQ
ncbi:hypothetical protein BRD56_05920 [Thermoplasmatales archaeon SW_10_69_26]|nr:MAG: hypothetical protein BRD56_05920 [Thermoplasmatales archaeon SW_10_69_26]